MSKKTVVDVLKVIDENSRIRIRIWILLISQMYGSGIQIRTKISWIRNTD